MYNKTQILELFNSSDPQVLERLAREAQSLTRQYFGKTIGLYAPLYLSNHCANACVYCGFHAGRDIPRRKLSETEIETECRALAQSGVQTILLLTGESRKDTPPEYLEQAVRIAKKYFAGISIEVYPLETAEYVRLNTAGCDGVTIFQETYDRERYAVLHPAGKKSDYAYRYDTPRRAALGGIRQITIGPLLGLADWRADIFALYDHLRTLEKEFPGVEYALSFPRLQKLNDYADDGYLVSDEDMVKIICLTRILFPRAGLNLSTREQPKFRDRAVHFGITKISAGSLTSVGGYADKPAGAGQFETNDNRSVAEIKTMLERQGYDPVFTEWRCLAG